MHKYLFVIAALFMLASCSKKSNPSTSKTAKVIYNAEAPVPTTATTTESRPAVKRKADEFPKTIYVNDAAAKKSVDGRLYYDVKGHRYWKNYKDGQYYLFDKSMYNNPDFKPPVQ